MNWVIGKPYSIFWSLETLIFPKDLTITKPLILTGAPGAPASPIDPGFPAGP